MEKIKKFLIEKWFETVLFLILVIIVIFDIFLYTDSVDLISLATFFLALAAFFSILQGGYFFRVTKRLSDRERKDKFLPTLFVERVSVFNAKTAKGNNYLLKVVVVNGGHGVAIYKGFEIPDESYGNKSCGGDMGRNKVIHPTSEGQAIYLHIFPRGLSELKDYHQKKLFLTFSDVFDRNLRVQCTLYAKDNEIIYTKTSTSFMSFSY